MLERIAEMVTDVALVEQQPRMEGRHMSMMLVGKVATRRMHTMPKMKTHRGGREALHASPRRAR